MEFTIGQKDILLCAQRAQGFINLKGANPVLSNVRIKTVKDGIKVFATDYDVGLSGVYPASVQEEGEVAINGRTLFDIVRQLPEEEIRFRYAGSGRCEVDCGRSNFKLATIDPDDYPEEPELPEKDIIEIDSATFRDMLDKTVYAASQNESRMALNGIYCQFYPNSLKVVATDGHRLAYISRTVDLPITDKVSMIFPRKGVLELKKLLDEGDGDEKLHVLRTENRIFFKKGSLLFFTREVEGSYPNYEQVIPYRNSREAVMDVESAIKAIRRVSTVASEKSKLAHFNFKKDKLEISSEASEVGEAFEELDIEYDSAPVKTGLNATYVIETLGHITSDKVLFKAEGPEDALLVQPVDDDDYLSIIMPMRI